MSRPRKAAKILEARGAFKANPQRRRKDIDGVGPISDPPDYFTDLEHEMWSRIVQMVPPGVVTGSDDILIEILARSWAKLRLTETEDITAAQMAQIINGCNSLCLSPQARTKIPPPTDKPKNAFDGY